MQHGNGRRKLAVFGTLRKVALKGLQSLHPKGLDHFEIRRPRREYLPFLGLVGGFALDNRRRSFFLHKALRTRFHKRIFVALTRPSTRDALLASRLCLVTFYPPCAVDRRNAPSGQLKLVFTPPRRTTTHTYRQVKHPVLLLGAHFFFRGCSGVAERLVADVLAGLEDVEDAEVDVDVTELMARFCAPKLEMGGGEMETERESARASESWY